MIRILELLEFQNLRGVSVKDIVHCIYPPWNSTILVI